MERGRSRCSNISRKGSELCVLEMYRRGDGDI